MSAESDDYELLTKRIISDLLEVAPESPPLHNQRVAGKGATHQIDVLWEVPPELGGPCTAIFECKHHKRNVEQKDIIAFKGVVDDIAAVRGPTYGVFVVSSGYQKGARTFASTYDIVILELREPQEGDWHGRIRQIEITIHAQIPRITDWDIRADSGHADQNPPAGAFTDHPIVLPNGERTTLGKIVTEGTIQGFGAQEPVRVTRQLPQPATLEGTSIRIQSVSATVAAEQITLTSTVGGARLMSLVLNACIPGAAAFIRHDGHVFGDVDELRGLLLPRDPF